MALVVELFQQTVALCEGFLVLEEVVEVFLVGLGDDAVEELTPDVASTGYENLVGGGYDDERNAANMLGEGGVGLLVVLHLFGLSAALHTGDLDGLAVQTGVTAMDGEVVLTIFYILTVYRIEIALTEREIVYGVEEVGFANAVVTDEAIEVGGEVHVGLGVGFEIGEFQIVEIHGYNVLMR